MEKIFMTKDEKNILIAMYNQGFRFIARDDSVEHVGTFTEKPVNAYELGGYCWTGSKGCVCREASCFGKMFPFLKPEQPMEIKKLLGEVQ